MLLGPRVRIAVEDIPCQFLALLRRGAKIGKLIQLVLGGSITLSPTVHLDPLRRLVLVVPDHFLQGLVVVLFESLTRNDVPLYHVGVVLVGYHTVILKFCLFRLL